MNKYKFVLILLFVSFVAIGCGDDDPEPSGNKEVEVPQEPGSNPEKITPIIDNLKNNSLRVGDEVVINGKFATKDNKVYINHKDRIDFTVKSESQEQIICQIPDNIDIAESKSFSLYVAVGEEKAEYYYLTIFPKNYPYIRSLDKDIYQNNDKIKLTGFNFDKQDSELYVAISSSGMGGISTDFFTLKDGEITVNSSGTEIVVDTSMSYLYFTGNWEVSVKSNNLMSNFVKVSFK